EAGWRRRPGSMEAGDTRTGPSSELSELGTHSDPAAAIRAAAPQKRNRVDAKMVNEVQNRDVRRTWGRRQSCANRHVRTASGRAMCASTEHALRAASAH